MITQLLLAQRMGFVRPVAGGVPLLFRALAVEGTHFADLAEGQKVTYTMERDLMGRGARATHVRPIDSPAPGSTPADAAP